MSYWIIDSITGIPAFLWMYFGVGVPLALALLPRREWRHKAQVLALAIALGSGASTAWMFVLAAIGAETRQALLRTDLILAGMGLIALLSAVIAWRKRHLSAGISSQGSFPFAWDEKLIIVLIITALIVRWVVTAYWPFTAYDTLWVYGYQARLYTLTGYIPQEIGYYPQYIQLQYAYAQILHGSINDHIARASVMFLHIGSILAAHTLGARLVNRRTGIWLAGIWALYPHVGDWARAGDLEIPLTFLFTLAAAYFLDAWMQPDHPHKRRYAIIAGIILGIGMWTKPTMGGFIWGVALLTMIEFARVLRGLKWRISPAIWQNARPRFETAIFTGLACIPLGSVWYIRNIAYGHSPIDFPPSFWLTQAMRSGVEFGWLIVATIILLSFIYFTQRAQPDTRITMVGVVLLTFGLAPTILAPRPIVLLEWLMIAGGAGILAFSLWRYAREHASQESWRVIQIAMIALLLALPYFVTWFMSYSYHYRLSFAVVPLLILPTAALIAYWRTPALSPLRRLRLLVAPMMIALSIPGVVSTIYDLNGGWDYLWTDKYPTDNARYQSGNAALMRVVEGLEIWKQEHPGQALVVSAPNVDRLPFFFPMDEIRVDESPTRLTQIDDAAYFVYGSPETIGAYESVPFFDNQVVNALGRTDILRRAWWMDDGIFSYDIYELHTPLRFNPVSQPNGRAPEDVVIGGFARYLGYDISGLEFWPDRRLVFKIYWEVLAPPQGDYVTLVHLRDDAGNLLANWDAPVAQTPLGYYSTWVWEVGETIIDERGLRLPEGVLPLGEDYQLVIGLYDSTTLERLPVMVNGQPAGDDYVIENRIDVLISPPSS